MPDALSRRISKGVAVVAALAAGYYWAFGGAYTFGGLRDLEVRVEAQAAEVASRHAELDSIRIWADSLTADPWVIERVARERYGFVRDGEVLIRFVETDDADRSVEAPSED